MLTFDGTGNITLLGDAKNVQMINSNRFVFTVNETTKNGIILIVTAPNVTNIDLRELADEFNNETFSRRYMIALAPFKALRFSTWMIARYDWRYVYQVPNADVNWSERRPVTYYTQFGHKMVSIEYIVELTNLLQKDIWLSMPPLATLDYMTQMAQFVFDNLNSQSIIYVEMSSNIGFNGHNRTANMIMIKAWKSVFNDLDSRQRLKFILSTTIYAYFENVMSKYSANDLNEFDAYSIRGEIAYYSPFNFNGYNITLSSNFTTDNINDILRQQIYNDDKDNIYQIQKVAYTFNFGSIMSNPVIKKPLIAYGSDFLVNAPSFAYRAKMATPTSPELVKMEQDLEYLIIDAQRQPIIKDMFLDYMERWYRLGGGLMFLTDLVENIDTCPTGGNKCGYKSILENLNQDLLSVPKYAAAIDWLNGNRSKLPFTSADLPQILPVSCQPKCVWGTCFNGTCTWFVLFLKVF